MTCQELRLTLEDKSRSNHLVRESEVAEHLAKCPECASFVRAEQQLLDSLQVVRQSVPQLPSSLDVAVLANFRTHCERSKPLAAPAIQKKRMVLLPFAMAAAAAVLVLAAVFLVHSRINTAIARLPQAPTVPAPRELAVRHQNIPPAIHTAKHVKPKPAQAKPKDPSTEVATSRYPLPAGFSSLMYCDQLSCPGGLEMIRVQLPPFAGGIRAVSEPAPVYADVLVGADGIARGIRIEQ